MTISVQCPGCKSKLNAPPSAAGKKVKCPKCAAMLTVPAGEDFDVVDDFEVVDDAPKAKKPPLDDAPAKKKRPAMDDDDRPAKKSKSRYDDDEDDYDDEDDRPRKKKGKKKPAPKNNMPLFIGLGVLSVLLLGVGGFFLFGGKKDKKGSGTDAAANDGWVSFSPPDGSYSARFPNSPSSTDLETIAGLTGEYSEELKAGIQAMEKLGMKMENYMSSDGSRRYIATTLKFPQALPDEAAEIRLGDTLREQSRIQSNRNGEKILGEETITFAGRSSTVTRSKAKNGKHSITVSIIKGDKGYSLTVVDDSELSMGDEKVKKYFESMSVNAGSTPAPDPRRRGR